MRYPNRRYGNPQEFQYYAIAWPSTKELAKHLKRSERSIRDWLSGAKRVPWWVPELLRLQQMERYQRALEMGYASAMPKRALASVSQSGDLVDLTRQEEAQDAGSVHTEELEIRKFA